LLNVQPFTIAIPNAALTDLRERLGRVRWPDQIDGIGWQQGTERAPSAQSDRQVRV
jgi:hypothetical protein